MRLIDRISTKERMFLQEALTESQSSKPSRIPWLKIGLSVPVWAIAVAHITQVVGVVRLI